MSAAKGVPNLATVPRMPGPAKDWRFPAICPSCLTSAGWPLRVDERGDEWVAIWVRCNECAREWTMSSDAPPLFLKVKRDRRASE